MISRQADKDGEKRERGISRQGMKRLSFEHFVLTASLKALKLLRTDDDDDDA